MITIDHDAIDAAKDLKNCATDGRPELSRSAVVWVASELVRISEALRMAQSDSSPSDDTACEWCDHASCPTFTENLAAAMCKEACPECLLQESTEDLEVP